MLLKVIERESDQSSRCEVRFTERTFCCVKLYKKLKVKVPPHSHNVCSIHMNMFVLVYGNSSRGMWLRNNN